MTKAADTSLAAERPRRGMAAKILYGMIAYCGLSSLTLPVVNSLWIGELPLFALIQLPKTIPANWARTEVVMTFIKAAGLSSGSFSPDYIMARPYGLMLIYVVPILFVIILRASESRAKLPNRLVFGAFLALVIDFGMTLAFAGQRSLTIY